MSLFKQEKNGTVFNNIRSKRSESFRPKHLRKSLEKYPEFFVWKIKHSGDAASCLETRFFDDSNARGCTAVIRDQSKRTPASKASMMLAAWEVEPLGRDVVREEKG